MNQFQSWYRVQPKAIRAIFTINVVFYVLWVLILSHIGVTRMFVWEFLALNPELPQVLLRPWQVITYNFIHLGTGFWGLLHLVFNMLWLYWIGKEYEELNGSHRLLAIYLIGGLGGAFLTILFYNIFPGAVLVHGASASVLGVMMAVAITYPYKSIGLLFIGTVRLLYVVIGFLVLDILFIAGSTTAVTAHFGGALAGLLFAKGEASGRDLSSWTYFLLGERKPARGRKSRKPPKKRDGFFEKIGSWLGGQEPEEARIAGTIGRARPEPESTSSAGGGDIDKILDKISERGYESLTDEEKQALYEASKR